MVGQALLLTAIALAIGGGGAIALARVLAALLFGVSPRDPVTPAGVAALLAVVACAATMIPAMHIRSSAGYLLLSRFVGTLHVTDVLKTAPVTFLH